MVCRSLAGFNCYVVWSEWLGWILLASLVLFEFNIIYFTHRLLHIVFVCVPHACLYLDYHGSEILLNVPVTVNNFVPFTRFMAPLYMPFQYLNLFTVCIL